MAYRRGKKYKVRSTKYKGRWRKGEVESIRDEKGLGRENEIGLNADTYGTSVADIVGMAFFMEGKRGGCWELLNWDLK